jgi:hypothetical protein
MDARLKGYKGTDEARFNNYSDKPIYVLNDRRAVIKNGKIIRYLGADEKPKAGEDVKMVIVSETVAKNEVGYGDAVIFDSNGNGKVDSKDALNKDAFFNSVDYVSYDIVDIKNEGRQAIRTWAGLLAFQDAFDTVTGDNQTGFLSRKRFMNKMFGGADDQAKIYDLESKKEVKF